MVSSGATRARFEFVAKSTKSAPVGQLKLTSGRDWFRSRSVTTFAVAGRTATWAGTGSWNGHAGYSFTATAIDQARNGHDSHHSRLTRTFDQLRITVRNASGTVVFTIDGPVTRGNIVVSSRSGSSHDHDGRDGFRPTRLPMRS